MLKLANYEVLPPTKHVVKSDWHYTTLRRGPQNCCNSDQTFSRDYTLHIYITNLSMCHVPTPQAVSPTHMSCFCQLASV